MKFTSLEPADLILIEPDVHPDARGFFLEFFHAEKYAAAGIHGPFVQDNHSRSARGTLRGLHAQLRHPQAKLLRVVTGEIWDVAVDIRVGSPTFGRYAAVTLTAENYKQLYVPVGFAHGFCVMSDWAEVEYKTTDFYDPGGELRLRWDDPELAIPWPVRDPILSPKDAVAASLAELMPQLPRL